MSERSSSPRRPARRGQTPSSPSSPPPSSSERRGRVRRRGQRVAEEEADDGEELMDDALVQRDYRAIPELDRYEAKGIGSDDASELSLSGRIEAEREMRRREREQAARRGHAMPAAMDSDDDDEPAPRRRRLARDEELDDDEAGAGDGEAEAGDHVDLQDVKGPLREWVQLEAPRREIIRQFRQFLNLFVDASNEPVYPAAISRMAANNESSLHVNYVHLSQSTPLLAIWVADVPKEMLEIFDECARDVVFAMYPQYSQVTDEIHVRVTKLPIVDSLRELRQVHLNALIKVSGVVTRRTSVFPQLKLVRFNCLKCGYLTAPMAQNSTEEVRPGSCPECQSKGPFAVNSEKTVYRNFQKLTLQESPGSVPAGRVPRQKDVILLYDLIDSARPGEEVEVTGVYSNQYDAGLNLRQGFPVFATVIEANHVVKKGERSDGDADLTDEDRAEIVALSKRPDVAELVFRSVAPSIFGHDNIKTALALSMFGGVSKQLANRHRLRGDINVLIMGDPGVAKSQFLKYVEKTAPRAVYTTGKGASAVGLTAAVRLDPMTREWTLEGGALVLADKGVCLIDEFDKMGEQDRTSIHEAMEQQAISISKAGIIATLQARCAIVAAANPVSGRYDSTVTFAENVNLTDAILSRFDVLCVVRDTVDPVADARLATFVVDSHCKNHPLYQAADAEASAAREAAVRQADAARKEVIPQDMLRKYIRYARAHCQPRLHNVDEDKIASLYNELRRESMVSGGIPIAVRHIEGVVRMSEAHAKIHLRDYVNDDDVNVAIRVMLESFISTQKYAVMRTLTAHFRRYLTFKRDNFELLLYVLRQLVVEQVRYRQARDGGAGVEPSAEPVVVDLADFRAKAEELSISNLGPFFESDLFRENGFALNRGEKTIVQQIGVM